MKNVFSSLKNFMGLLIVAIFWTDLAKGFKFGYYGDVGRIIFLTSYFY
ncbi:hypothetical protein QIA41_02385 [Borreliella sinica]|nr:hypothetical protein [Borreliella sinica]WPM05930.1 hypothetical protein QIA41_02385 [Borreliella sinica]